MTVRRWLLGVAAIAVLILAYLNWRSSRPEDLPVGFVRSNGRIEAVEIDVATKTAGRIEAILVDEGDFVTAGQVVARMDTAVLEAQMSEAKAQLRGSQSSVEATRSNVTLRQKEKTAAEATLAQRNAELDAESRHFARMEKLVARNVESPDNFDTSRASFLGAKATVAAASANVAAADAAITTAKLQVVEAEASVDAANARIERLKADIDDSVLKSPRDGRVQYRVAQPGEVVVAGGKVMNLVDLADVYMTFFLPTAAAGRVKIGTEVRLVLDAAPQYVIPARATFVADVAQFTPKTVETAEERQKLTFRIKAHIDPELLKKYIRSVKTGLPGMAYVQLDPQAEWPTNLQVRLPE